MSASPPASEAALLNAIAATCLALALASVLVWCATFLVRLLRLRRSRRDALAEEELTAFVLDQLASYRSATPPPELSTWKRAILARVLQSLVEQTKGRDQAQLVALLERTGFRTEALQQATHGQAAKRQAACALLAHFDDEPSLAALNAALRDADFGVRLTAARALLQKDHVPSLRHLLDHMRFDEADPPLSLAELFARLPASLRPEAVALLGAELPPEWLRTLAIALARNQVYEAFDAIAALRRHASPRVRAATWVALRELGDPRAGEIVNEGLTDPIADVRCAATDCAGKLGGPAAVPVLARLACDRDWWVSYNAAAALWDFGADGRATLAAGGLPRGEGAQQFVREQRPEASHG